MNDNRSYIHNLSSCEKKAFFSQVNGWQCRCCSSICSHTLNAICLPHKNATAFIDNLTTLQRLQTEQRELAHTEKQLADRLAWGWEGGKAVASFASSAGKKNISHPLNAICLPHKNTTAFIDMMYRV